MFEKDPFVYKLCGEKRKTRCRSTEYMPYKTIIEYPYWDIGFELVYWVTVTIGGEDSYLI